MSKQPELQHPMPVKPVSRQLAPEQHFPGQPPPEEQIPELSLPERLLPEDLVQKDLVQDNQAQDNSVQKELVQEDPDPCLGDPTPSDDDGEEFPLRERKPEAIEEERLSINSYKTATTDPKEPEHIPSEYIPGFTELRAVNKDPEGVDDSAPEDDTGEEPRKLGSYPQERKHDTPTQDDNNTEAQLPGESNPEETETGMPLEDGSDPQERKNDTPTQDGNNTEAQTPGEGNPEETETRIPPEDNNDERSQPPSNSGPAEYDPHRTSLGSQPPNNPEPAENNPPPESRNTAEPTSNPETTIPNTDGAAEFQSAWSVTSLDSMQEEQDQPLSRREKLRDMWERCRETLTATCEKFKETLRAMPERCREALRATPEKLRDMWERCKDKTAVLVERTGQIIRQSFCLVDCVGGVVQECCQVLCCEGW